MTWFESTVCHTWGEQTSQCVVIWLVVLPWFWKMRFQFCAHCLRFVYRKNPIKTDLYIRYIYSIPNTRQTSRWVGFYLQSNMARPIIRVVHIVDISCHNQINCHFPVIGWKCDSTFLRIKYHRLRLYVVYTVIWWIVLVSWLGYL